MHAVDQATIGIVPLIMLRRTCASEKYNRQRRLDEIMRQASLCIERWIVVEILPALVVPAANIEKLLARLGGGKTVIAKIFWELEEYFTKVFEIVVNGRNDGGCKKVENLR